MKVPIIVSILFLIKILHPQDKSFSQEWFSYIGGNTADPSSYRLIFEDPGCEGSGDLCAIRTTVDWSTFEPDGPSLVNLYNESSGFAYAGFYLDGIVEKKPPL